MFDGTHDSVGNVDVDGGVSPSEIFASVGNYLKCNVRMQLD